eukprot:TRINITY_DN851_c0_g1_i2.p1 TRINITY_DN851_c0_g1~~TRINITY_DN851_c0_g1_i2.p1  ORF type:complete len:137 (-),score=11.38 TRINITY_DN851_c0_g1_i2:455-865(-)
MQHRLVHQRELYMFKQRFEQTTWSDRLRMDGLKKNPSAILTAIPDNTMYQLAGPVFRAIVKLQLGLQVFKNQFMPGDTCECDVLIDDPNHGAHCRLFAGTSMSDRHDSLMAMMGKIAQSASVHIHRTDKNRGPGLS